MVKWILAFAMLLQFLAFWFAAPELLGANTMKRLESQLIQLVSKIPIIILSMVILAFILVFFIGGVSKGMKAQDEGIEMSELIQYYIVLGVGMLIYALFMIFYKRIKRFLVQRLSEPLIHRLIENTELRRVALSIGAALFTLGFLIEFVIVLLS